MAYLVIDRHPSSGVIATWGATVVMDLIFLMDTASEELVTLSTVVIQAVATGRSEIVEARSQRKEVTCRPSGSPR
jgi:hypothetical protein